MVLLFDPSPLELVGPPALRLLIRFSPASPLPDLELPVVERTLLDDAWRN